MALKIICVLWIVLNFFPTALADNKTMKIRLGQAQFPEDRGFKPLLDRRHSCRAFQEKTLRLNDLAALLWASCGKKPDAVTSASRTIPSAGATNPLEVYIVVGRNAVGHLKEGLYHYIIEEHSLELIKEGDRRRELKESCLGQNFISQAPVSLVIAADFTRTTQRYLERGQRYVYMEAGHACQNVYLAAASLGLDTVEVGSFFDDAVKNALGLPKEYTPLAVMPIGYARIWDR